MIISFPKRTTARVKGLSEYFHREVLTADLGFICRHWDQCRTSCRTPNFYEGQLHHIGHHYDLEIDGRPTRIVIVGQEYGHSPPRVSLKKRHFTESGNTKGFRGRNPHMRGTTTLLRLVLGRDPGEDFAGEQLLVKPPIHIFEGFALVISCSVQLSTNRSEDNQPLPCGTIALNISARQSRYLTLRSSLLKDSVCVRGLGMQLDFLRAEGRSSRLVSAQCMRRY
jgi:hypothetical protein